MERPQSRSGQYKVWALDRVSFIYIEHSRTWNCVNWGLQGQKKRHYCIGSSVLFHVVYTFSLLEEKLLKVRSHFDHFLSLFRAWVRLIEDSLSFAHSELLIPADWQFIAVKFNHLYAHIQPQGEPKALAVRFKSAEMLYLKKFFFLFFGCTTQHVGS